MNTRKLKKALILNIPYAVIGLYATKLAEGWRLAEGLDASQKFLHYMAGLGLAMQSPLPSFHPSDMIFSTKLRSAARKRIGWWVSTPAVCFP